MRRCRASPSCSNSAASSRRPQCRTAVQAAPARSRAAAKRSAGSVALNRSPAIVSGTSCRSRGAEIQARFASVHAMGNGNSPPGTPLRAHLFFQDEKVCTETTVYERDRSGQQNHSSRWRPALAIRLDCLPSPPEAARQPHSPRRDGADLACRDECDPCRAKK